MKNFLFLLVAVVSIILYEGCCGTLKKMTVNADAMACVGPSISKVVGESESYKDPLGFQAGVGLEGLKLTEKMSFRPEMILSVQGAKYEDTYDQETIKGRVNLLYLNFPLMFRYDLKKKFYAEAGFQPGILLRARDKFKRESDGYEESYDFKDFINTFDGSLPLGLGYQYNDRLGFGLRVIPGLTNINKDSDYYDRNFVVALRMSYNLMLNKKK